MLLSLLATLASCGKSGGGSSAKKAKVNEYLVYGQILSPEQYADAENLPNPCAEFRSKIPADWQQGYLDVPEIPSRPDGHKIKIFYYGKIDPLLPPTVFFNGGPGETSHNSFRRLIKTQPEVEGADPISFVFIDQRGNGCSSFYPQGTTDETAERLRLYGTRGIVSDAELVRKHLLGDRPWIAFGQSYGAFVVHRYLQLAPEGLLSGHAHANALNADGYERMKLRIASQARVLEQYLTEFPSDRQAIDVLNRELVQNRCFEFMDGEEQVKLCGFEVMESFVSLLGFTDSWGELHSWMEYLVIDGEIQTDELTNFLGVFAGGGAGNPLNIKRAANRVISWVDRNTVSMDEYYCYKARRDLLPAVDLKKSVFHECAWAMTQPEVSAPHPNWVTFLKRDILTPTMFKEVVEKNSKIHFYWYAGMKDTYVPVETFKEQADLIQHLPNVHYTIFPNSGHDGFHSEQKVWDELVVETLKNR